MDLYEQDSEEAPERVKKTRRRAQQDETEEERVVKEAIAEYCANNPDAIDREFVEELPDEVHEALQDPSNWKSSIDDVREGLIDADVVDEPDPYNRWHRYEFRHPEYTLDSLRAYPVDVDGDDVTVRVQGE